ncbi:hypothetical protein EJB05_19069, partial [Eragrostis curvula]
MRPLVRSSVSPSSSPPLPQGEGAAATGEAAITVDSDMVVILASLLCALISVVGLALVARCACSRQGRSNSMTVSSSSSAAPPPAKGLKKAAIEALPTVHGGGGGSSCSLSECTICLAELAEGEELRVLPHCGHAFHVACIDTWLGAHASCPSCRATVMVPEAARCRRCGAAQGAAAAAANQDD